MKFFYLFFIFCFGFAAAQQKEEHLSSYFMTSVTYKHDKNWSAYLEVQGRGIEEYGKIDYYELKGGIGYQLNKKNQVLLGIGRYGTYENSRMSQEEFRIWGQYSFSHKLENLKFDHRVRAEKRFFHYPQTGVSKNDERFRYRLSATLPLGKAKVEAKTFFVNAYDEIFLNFDKPAFKRNRVFGGFGYQFTDFAALNLGYLWQREFSLKGNKNLHYLYTALSFSLSRPQTGEKNLPEAHD